MDWALHGRRVLEQLGEDATYTPSGGGAPSTVRGVFQQPYQGSAGMESSQPTFTCMADDVPGLKRGATFAMRATVFTVTAVHSDAVIAQVVAVLQKT